MGRGPNLRLDSLLNCYSYFSEGGGVSSPRTLVEQAKRLGFRSIALTDSLSVGGVVELHQAARAHKINALVGTTVPIGVPLEGTMGNYPLVLISASRQGYKTLNELITQALASEQRSLDLKTLPSHNSDLFCLTGGRLGLVNQGIEQHQVGWMLDALHSLKQAFGSRLLIQLQSERYPGERIRNHRLFALAKELGLHAVAAPEVRYARRELFRLYDALLCGRLGITVETPRPLRPQTRAHYLKSPSEFGAQFRLFQPLANAEEIARECAWELLPDRLVPAEASIPEGLSAREYLWQCCFKELPGRYSGRKLVKAKERLEYELREIAEVGWDDFFLCAAEVCAYCKSKGILAAGRGSAAASIVCFLLGVSQADPIEHDLLFERFLAPGKRAMPDIDIDIDSYGRDEVLEWVEQRWKHSAMVCNKITYHLPSAIQDLGRALGLPFEQLVMLTKALGRDYRHLRPHKARQAQEIFDGVLRNDPAKEKLLGLLELMEAGHVRQLTPHSGGMVLGRDSLEHYSPQFYSTGGIRQLQLNKDDVEAIGLIKLDLLGLRMLAALRRARQEVFRLDGVWLDLDNLPDDPAIWQRINRGDTMGLFQIESPAQTRMSLDFQPKNLVELASQIALVRPGPIQSGSVHPFVRRKKGLEPVTYLHPALEPILSKTLGVVLYQEDALRIAHYFAGYDWASADRFRKKVSGWEELEELEPDREPFVQGAIKTVGATREEALAVFDMVAQFRGYGFAQSHAITFAIHCYSSAWLRHYYPTEFMAALLTEQPGMWSRSTLRQEAKAWGVEFLPLDINASFGDYRPEVIGTSKKGKRKAVRIALGSVKEVSADLAQAIVEERMMGGAFASLADFFHRVEIKRDSLEALIRAGAFDALMERREALYQAGTLLLAAPSGNKPLVQVPEDIDPPVFPKLNQMEWLSWEYQTKGLTTNGLHPMDLLRQELRDLGCEPLARLVGPKYPYPRKTRTAGLVIARQKPGTAKGFAFFVLEDGPSRLQMVIPPGVWEQFYAVLRDGSALMVEGWFGDRTLRVERVALLQVGVRVRGYAYGG